MAQETEQNNETQNAKPEQPVIVSDDVMTQYGLTVGQIVAERDKFFLAAKEYEEQTIPEKNAQLLTQSDRIVTLETAAKVAEAKIADVTARLETAEAQVKKLAVRSAGAAPAMEHLPNGSLRLMVTVPEEQAIPIQSWADSAGEDVQSYCQKLVEDALVSAVSS